jgi:5-methylcytosine-specific restriction endonuclease McrA
MAPHRVIPWQRAIVLTFLGKVDVVVSYDEVIRSPSTALRAPAVVRMRRADVPRRAPLRFCRENVFRRDGCRCQYCGAVLRARELTFDHVLPRARGGRTDWDNIVTCCRPCNDHKRDRTPDEAGMTLVRRPARPSWLPPSPAFGVIAGSAPAEWRDFV